MKRQSPSGRLVWSTLAAQSSEQIALAAGPIAVVIALGGGATDTGFLQMIQTLPFLLLSLPVGVMVDRVSRRALMMWSEVLKASTLFGVVLALAFNALDVPLLAIMGFLGAIGTLTFSVASPALLSTIAEPAELPAVNRSLELARSAAFVAGPPLGGALVGWTGAQVAFLAAMSASLCAILLVSRIDEPRMVPRPRRHFWHDLTEGYEFVLRDRYLLPIGATAMLFNVGWFLLQAVFVVFMIDHLGATPGGVGMVFGLYGVGMIAGAIAAKPLSRLLPFGALIVIGPLGGFLGACLVLASLGIPSPVPVAIGLFCFGFGPILWTINTTSLRQVITPPVMQGRVSAVLTLATSGARPVGAGLGILVAGTLGVEACLAASAICFLLQLLTILSSSPARLRDLPLPGGSHYLPAST